MNLMNKEALMSWFFVLVQSALLIILIFITANRDDVSLVIVTFGRVVEFCGVVVLLNSIYDLRKSLTALPSPKQNGELQVHGLYRIVRHPMYVGVITLSLGLALIGGSLQKYILVGSLVLLFSIKARYEERLLLRKYPGYLEYMKRTPRFIPKLRYK